MSGSIEEAGEVRTGAYLYHVDLQHQASCLCGFGAGIRSSTVIPRPGSGSWARAPTVGSAVGVRLESVGKRDANHDGGMFGDAVASFAEGLLYKSGEAGGDLDVDEEGF